MSMPAGEAPIAGIDRDSFVTGLRARGHRDVVPLEGAPQLAPLVRDHREARRYRRVPRRRQHHQWAYALPGELQALGGKP